MHTLERRHDSSESDGDGAARDMPAASNGAATAHDATLPFAVGNVTLAAASASATAPVPLHVSRRAKKFGRLALTVAEPRDANMMMILDLQKKAPVFAGAAVLSLARTKPAAFWDMQRQKAASLR
jgi:hypothetical protein